jgi:hypothetical protein
MNNQEYLKDIYTRIKGVSKDYIKRTLVLGKYKEDGKTYTGKVSLELRAEGGGKVVFSATGEVYRGKKPVMCGQCLDDLQKHFPTRKDFVKIYRWWKLYHLNDMHAGTTRQEEVLNTISEELRDYDKDCEVLKKAGVYEDNGYVYGTAWLYVPIPKEDLIDIYHFIKGE